ncbi:hypothetical protein ACJ41O_014134 [Fusarium nematophilum]
MQHIDPSADELGLDWGEDTIYCESICRPEDVYYEGSDDELYENPTARKLRYEAAGQEYLEEGKPPIILTAGLKGPFDGENVGWANPWLPKNCTSKTPRHVRTSPRKLARSARMKRNVSIQEAVPEAPNESFGCHLPSPESLKQASVTEANTYLEEDELAKVREWRSSMPPIGGDKDRFWASTPQATQSERKRKAKGSTWLKVLASKRRRTDIMESGSVNTPVPRRSHPPTFARDEVEHDTTLNTSFNSLPGRLPSSAMAAVRFFSGDETDDWERDTQVASDVDELVEPVHDSSAMAIGSSIKRISPCRDMQKIGLDGGARDIEDELSREAMEEAAATLSSPVSQRRSTPAPAQSADSSQQSLERQTPKMEMHGDIEDQGTAEPLPAFETQEDQSFCFKMRSKLNTNDYIDGDETYTSAGDLMEISEGSWSGLSSPGDAAAKDPARDSKVDTTVARFSSPTSAISSISSEEFNGFSLSGEPPDDSYNINTASQSSLTSAKDTESLFSHFSEEGVAKVSRLQSTSEPDERQAERDSDEEAGEEIDETEEESGDESDEESYKQSDSQSDDLSEADTERDGQAQVDGIVLSEDEATEFESVQHSKSQEEVQGIIDLYSASSTASTASETHII